MNLCKTCGTICPFDDERTECDAYAPMTNENWFISLPTEEKAKVLYKFYCDGRNDELQVYVSINVNSFKEWLNQPHTFIDY